MRSRQEALDWCESKVGQGLDYDGAYGDQCVDFFNFYFEFVFGITPFAGLGSGIPDAKGLFNTSYGGFTYIRNDSTDPNLIPEPGDVMIWGVMPGNEAGHVAVCADADVRGYTVWEQNAYGKMWVTKNSRGYEDYLIGWMRPNWPSEGENMVTAEVLDAIYLDMIGRPRNPGEGDDVYIGKDTNWAVREIHNSNESKAYKRWLQAQIDFVNTWSTKVAELSARPTKDEYNALKTAMDTAKAELNDVSAKYQAEASKSPVTVEKVVEKQVVVDPTHFSILELVKAIIRKIKGE